MSELYPLWVGIAYGTVIVVFTLIPVLIAFYRWVKAIGERVVEHEHELYGIKGENGMKRTLASEVATNHKTRQVVRRVASWMERDFQPGLYREGDL